MARKQDDYPEIALGAAVDRNPGSSFETTMNYTNHNGSCLIQRVQQLSRLLIWQDVGHRTGENNERSVWQTRRPTIMRKEDKILSSVEMGSEMFSVSFQSSIHLSATSLQLLYHTSISPQIKKQPPRHEPLPVTRLRPTPFHPLYITGIMILGGTIALCALLVR